MKQITARKTLEKLHKVASPMQWRRFNLVGQLPIRFWLNEGERSQPLQRWFELIRVTLESMRRVEAISGDHAEIFAFLSNRELLGKIFPIIVHWYSVSDRTSEFTIRNSLENSCRLGTPMVNSWLYWDFSWLKIYPVSNQEFSTMLFHIMIDPSLQPIMFFG